MVIVLVVLVVPGVFLQVMQVVQVGQGVLVVQEVLGAGCATDSSGGVSGDCDCGKMPTETRPYTHLST